MAGNHTRKLGAACKSLHVVAAMQASWVRATPARGHAHPRKVCAFSNSSSACACCRLQAPLKGEGTCQSRRSALGGERAGRCRGSQPRAAAAARNKKDFEKRNNVNFHSPLCIDASSPGQTLFFLLNARSDLSRRARDGI